MNSKGNEYYAGDVSMNALYQMNTIGDPMVLGNIGYVTENSILKPYPKEMIGQDTTFTYMGNYDTSGTIIPYVDPSTNYTSNFYTGLDLSGSIQQCIDLSCNAFVMTTLTGPTNTQISATTFMSTAFATPFSTSFTSSGGVDYIPRIPNPNAKLFIRNPTVNNSQYCNKNITGINSGVYGNYIQGASMDDTYQCISITTSSQANEELRSLSNQIDIMGQKINKQISKLKNKTLTVNQQEQLNEIILNAHFEQIDKMQNTEKEYQQSVVNANNIKQDSDLVVLMENQSFILWSVLAISVALITIHIIRN
jgi:hypothetical protein